MWQIPPDESMHLRDFWNIFEFLQVAGCSQIEDPLVYLMQEAASTVKDTTLSLPRLLPHPTLPFHLRYSCRYIKIEHKIDRALLMYIILSMFMDVCAPYCIESSDPLVEQPLPLNSGYGGGRG